MHASLADVYLDLDLISEAAAELELAVSIRQHNNPDLEGDINRSASHQTLARLYTQLGVCNLIVMQFILILYIGSGEHHCREANFLNTFHPADPFTLPLFGPFHFHKYASCILHSEHWNLLYHDTFSCKVFFAIFLDIQND